MLTLIIDHDLPTVEVLTYQLGKIGLKVVAVSAASLGLTMARRHQPDLVLVSDSLPNIHASSMCTQIRSQAPGALIVLCSETYTDVKASGTIADHCLAKSVKMPQLLSQIKTLLWRGKAYLPAERIPPVVVGDITVNLGQCEVSLLGRRIEVTVKEAELLYYLASKSPQYVDRDMILNCVWNSTSRGHRDTRLDVFICTLRRKMEPDPQNPRYVIYRRGVGYRLSADSGGEVVDACVAGAEGLFQLSPPA